MLDFLRKDVVKSYSFNNVGMNRNFEKKVLVNGHTAVMTCAAPIAVMEGVLYKVYNKTSELTNEQIHGLVVSL